VTGVIVIGLASTAVVLSAIGLVLAAKAFNEGTRETLRMQVEQTANLHSAKPPTTSDLQVAPSEPETYRAASRALGIALRCYGSDVPDRVIHAMMIHGVLRSDQELDG
jgi:hypothetical protein